MSMSLTQLRQIVAEAKNDLNVVEQELAKLVDEQEKRKDELPIHENALPAGTVLMGEEEHRRAPIGTAIRTRDRVTGYLFSGIWEKVDTNAWYLPGHFGVLADRVITDAEVAWVAIQRENVVVEHELAEPAGEKEKRKDDLPENHLPAGTVLMGEEEHRRAPIGTVIMERNQATGNLSFYRWKKMGPNCWRVPDRSYSLPLTDAEICEEEPHNVNVVVDS